MKSTRFLITSSGSRILLCLFPFSRDRVKENLAILIFCGCLFCMPLLMQGCIRESMEDCTIYEGVLRIILPDGSDITLDSAMVGTVGVYQFESNGFVRQIPWSRDAAVTIGVEKDKSLALVAWGNLPTDTLQVIPPLVGNSLDSTRVSLRKKADGYQFPAPDLFYGCYEAEGSMRGSQQSREEMQLAPALTRSAQTQSFNLVMERKVSALSVHIVHLAEYFGEVPGNLRLLVYGTCASLNFRGEPMDGAAIYAPALQVVSGMDEWATSLFRVFSTPPDHGMSLKLYRNDELIVTATLDNDGNLLQAIPGKEVYVTLDFRYSRLRVEMEVKSWGSTKQNVEF